MSALKLSTKNKGEARADYENCRHNGGQCVRSVVVKPCERSNYLMSEADKFKNDFARGSEQAGAIKRKVHSCEIIH